MKTRTLAFALAGLLAGSLALAADWPQFRGPNRDGISNETGLLKSWPKDGPKLAWSFKNAGLGFSGFSVVDGVAYTMGTRGDSEIVLALDAAKGTELWTAKVGPVFAIEGNVWGDGPRSTPTVDGKFLYALGAEGSLVCLDTNGKEVWRKHMRKDLGGEMMDAGNPSHWGYSESVLIDGKLLICTPGGKKGTLAALDKTTGAVVWRSTGITYGAPYSSVVVADIHGVRQYIQTGYVDEKQGGFVSGVAAADGKVLWTQNIFKQHSYAIAPNAIVRDNLVYVTSGYGGGCHLFEIAKDQSAKDKYDKARQKVMKNTHGGVVLLGDHVYGHSENAGWVCQELKSGKSAWLERNDLSARSGAVTAVDGMLYLLTEEGEVGLVEADPKEFRLVSTFTLPESSKFRGQPAQFPNNQSAKVWAHPVVANGRLYLRDMELVFCYDVGSKK